MIGQVPVSGPRRASGSLFRDAHRHSPAGSRRSTPFAGRSIASMTIQIKERL